MVSQCIPTQYAITRMTELQYARTGAASWRMSAGELHAFVTVMAAEGQVEAFLEYARPAPGVLPYSDVFTVGYIQNIDSAVLICAKHLSSLVDEHYISGTVAFRQDQPTPSEFIRLKTLQ